MHIYLWALSGSYVLGIILSIAMIGEPRKPSTPKSVAISSVISMAGAVVSAMYAMGVWK